jgi:hypothetical protein
MESPFTVAVPRVGCVVMATPVSEEPFTNLAMSIAVGVLSGTMTAPGPASGTSVPTVMLTVATVEVPAGLVTEYVNESGPEYPSAGV